MTVLEFITELSKIEVKIDAISALYHSFAYSFEDKVLKYDEKHVRTLLQSFSEEDFASFGTKLGRCFSDCQEEQKNLASLTDTLYAQNIEKVKNLLEKLVSIYYAVANNKSSKNENTATAIAQHDEYLKEVKGKLKLLNDAVEDANKLIDDKIFTLLINTVAILGIFVAIAYTGFGVTSIFSKISFSEAFVSSDNLIKTVFLLLMVALLSFNLLFLLVYFIYKLSRPLIIKIKKDAEGKETQETFSKTVNLTPFLWIDGIMLAITIVFFIWCINL